MSRSSRWILTEKTRQLYQGVYSRLSAAAKEVKLLVATYFESLRENAQTALNLPIQALHIDLVRGENQLDDLLSHVPDNLVLSLGVVDGRNIWKNDYEASLQKITKA